MKTKEQWLEEFDFMFRNMGKEDRDDLCLYLANALEQYAKEYCLEEIHHMIDRKMITLMEYHLSKKQEYESAMKKEIGV